MLLANVVFVAVSGLFSLSPSIAPIILWVVVLSYVMGWLALLLAFLIGVPATDAESVEPELVTPDRPAVMTPGSGAG